MLTGGSQRSNGSQSHSTSNARVSQLAAGGDLTLIANGGSITSQGAQMSAEGNAVLLATKNINFDVAHNTESSTSESSGKGWGFANNTSGLPFGTNNSRSEGSGSSDTITGTQLSVGGCVRMAATEGDITLTPANIAAPPRKTYPLRCDVDRPGFRRQLRSVIRGDERSIYRLRWASY